MAPGDPGPAGAFIVLMANGIGLVKGPLAPKMVIVGEVEDKNVSTTGERAEIHLLILWVMTGSLLQPAPDRITVVLPWKAVRSFPCA